MIPKFRLRLTPATALKAIALISLYLVVLALMPPARTTYDALAATYRSLASAERLVLAQAEEEPAR